MLKSGSPLRSNSCAKTAEFTNAGKGEYVQAIERVDSFEVKVLADQQETQDVLRIGRVFGEVERAPLAPVETIEQTALAFTNRPRLGRLKRVESRETMDWTFLLMQPDSEYACLYVSWEITEVE
jgi:hypothetical protein